MASKEKLRKRLGYATDAIEDMREELDELRADWERDEADLKQQVKAALLHRDQALARARGFVDQSEKMAQVIKERDDLRRQVQSARVSYEALGKALFPNLQLVSPGGIVPKPTSVKYGDFHLGGNLAGAIGVPITKPYGRPEAPLAPNAQEAVNSIMGLLGRWTPPSTPKPAEKPDPIGNLFRRLNEGDPNALGKLHTDLG